MMTKMSNEKALEYIERFMNKVSVAKESAELEDADKNGAIPGEPAGTVEVPVTKDSSPENKTETVNPAEGEFAAEKHEDLKDSSDGTQVEEMKANKDGLAEPVATDFNAGSIDKESGEKNMKEQERLQKLGKKIMEKVSSAKSQAPAKDQAPVEFEKLSAEEQAAVVEFKKVADAHYMDYVQSFAAGMQKKAENIQAVADAQGVPPEEAEAILDEIAAEDPSLVIPEEGGEMGEGELSPEDAALLEELASELEAAGVTPDELATAIAEMAEEEGAAVPEEAPVVEEDPAEVEKLAQDRVSAIKDWIRSKRQG